MRLPDPTTLGGRAKQSIRHRALHETLSVRHDEPARDAAGCTRGHAEEMARSRQGHVGIQQRALRQDTPPPFSRANPLVHAARGPTAHALVVRAERLAATPKLCMLRQHAAARIPTARLDSWLENCSPHECGCRKHPESD